MNLCINCKHVILDKQHPKFSKCALFSWPATVDQVTGEMSESRSIMCEVARYDFGNRCGSDGKHFKPKPAP